MTKSKGLGRALIFSCFLVLGGVFYPFSAFAIFIDDFLVNDTLREDLEEYPQIACDSAGNFVCLWVDYTGLDLPGEKWHGTIFIQGYDSQGNVRFGPKVMPTDSNRVLAKPALYVRPGGDFVIACSDYWNWPNDSTKTKINIQRYDINGNEIENRISFFFSDSSVGLPDESIVYSVTSDSSGRIIATWKSGSPTQAWAQIFGTDNNPLISPFKINGSDGNITASVGYNPVVVSYPCGKFVVSFWSPANGYFQALARIYNSDGTTLTNFILLSCDTIPITPGCEGPPNCNVSDNPDIDIVDGKNFMVTYSACGDEDENYVYLRVFDSLGNPVTSNRKINEGSAYTYFVCPEISCDGKGNCVVIWGDSRNLFWNGDLFIQRLDSLGNPIGSNHRVNNDIGQARLSNLEVVTNGKQVYSIWGDSRDFSNWHFDLYAQVMDLEKVGVFTPGDGTLDEKVNVQDIIYLVRYVFQGGRIPVSERWISDVTGDCKVNLADVIYLVNYVFKGGSAPQVGCAN